MEKDKQIIITTQTARLYLRKAKPELTAQLIVVSSNKYEKLIKKLANKEKQEVLIFDTTTNQNHRNLEIIEVKDHINKTGENPLIEHQKSFNQRFIDITDIYKPNNHTQARTTTSKGKRTTTNTHKRPNQKYASTYLCNIAIICAALQFKKIRGFLINVEI